MYTYTVQSARLDADLTDDGSWTTYSATDDAAEALADVAGAGRRIVPAGYPRSRWEYRAVRILDGSTVIVTDYPLDLDELADVREAVEDSRWVPDDDAGPALDAFAESTRRLLRV